MSKACLVTELPHILRYQYLLNSPVPSVLPTVQATKQVTITI